jgi:hypothetical protein
MASIKIESNRPEMRVQLGPPEPSMPGGFRRSLRSRLRLWQDVINHLRPFEPLCQHIVVCSVFWHGVGEVVGACSV